MKYFIQKIVLPMYVFFVVMLSFTTECISPKSSVFDQQQEKQVKILFVVGLFPLLPETTILNQITGLIDRKFDVWIYAMNGEGYTKKMHPDVTKYHLFDRTYFKTLPDDIHTYDIIYCQFGPLGRKFVEIKKQLNFKAKIVTCFRGYDMKCYHKKKSSKYENLFKYADLILPVCEYYKNILIKNGCPLKKIRVQHSAIDLSLFTFQERKIKAKEPIRLISVNRLVEKKGMEYSIKAVIKILNKYSDVVYVIVGDGPLMRPLRRLIRASGMRNKIQLLGWANQEEVINHLKKAHIVILPSVTASDGNEEGIPNTLKEAMAMGLPVVSTFHSGIPELVEDYISGLLVQQKDSNGLAKKIEFLINHPEKWFQMGCAGRSMVEQEFNLEKMNDRLVQLFQGLLKNEI